MAKITTSGAFGKALAELPLAQQRRVGAKFIANVLDLTDERRVERAQAVASTPDVGADELMDAYHSVHSVYVETHPSSGLVELDFSKQAEHFVAEACMACLAPIYPETQTQNLAVKVAMYCQMARTCAAIRHDEDYPKFEGAEGIVKKEVEAQYKILGEFLDSK